MIIHAPNVNNGGGLVLLMSVLEQISGPCILIADSRLKIDPRSGLQILQFDPTVLGRLRAEIALRRLSKEDQLILCFGNLPPLFSVSKPVFLFFQNTLLLPSTSFNQYKLGLRLRLLAERLWLSFGLSRVRTVIVQSEEVQKRFAQDYPGFEIKILPFAGFQIHAKQNSTKTFDFVYVSSADAHKNHLGLLSAWELLAKEGLFPSLALTLTPTATDLLSRVAKLVSQGLKIQNHPGLDREQTENLYKSSKALIFPSFTESLGLPLIEAKLLGLPILASELDYVREIVTPVQSFDPSSPKSIARAVARHLQKPIEATQKIYSPQEFIDFIGEASKVDKP